MKNIFLWAGLLALAVASAQAGEVYRWVDKSGVVHYGDNPGAEVQQVEQKEFHVPPAEKNANLPYETRRAQQSFPVTLYSGSNCGTPCQAARDFLNKRGIPFTEKTLSTREEISNFTKESGSDQAPTLRVGKTWLKNFNAEQWNSELDDAGYPKTAPYHPAKPAEPATEKPATE